MENMRVDNYVMQKALDLGVTEYNTQYWEAIDILN